MRIPFARATYAGRHRSGGLSAPALAVALAGLAAFGGLAVTNAGTLTSAGAAVDNSGLPDTVRQWINDWADRGWSGFPDTDYMSPRRLRGMDRQMVGRRP